MRTVLVIAALIFAVEVGAAGLSYRRHEERVAPELQRLGLQPAPEPERILPRDLPSGARISASRPPGREVPSRMVYFMNPSANSESYGASSVSEDRVKSDNGRLADEERRSMQVWERMPR